MTQIIDPYEPLAVNAGKIQAGVNRLNQRERRARILASTRKLIGERGSGDITVREIALISDVSPQTLYNLVGPRDQAIVDALNEYSVAIGRIAAHTSSLSEHTDVWISVAECYPDYARQSTLMFMTPMRNVYLSYRDKQVKSLTKLLKAYKKAGHMHFTTPAHDLAEQLILFSSAVWVDWSIRSFPLSELKEKIIAGLTKLMRD